MAYFTYILRCVDGSLYTGITTDLARRFAEHSGAGGKGARYTALHSPVRYEAAWRSADRAAASSLENRIKRLPRAEKDRLVSGETAPDPAVYERVHVSPPPFPKPPSDEGGVTAFGRDGGRDDPAPQKRK